MTVDDAPANARAALRVLLVEDSRDDAEILIEELRHGGYSVSHQRIETELEMRAALAAGTWQIVLCDIKLPHFDPLRALAVLRDLRLDLPFIVVSGAVPEETAIRLMRAGAHDFLHKHNLSRLVPAIERELREGAIRMESAALREQLLLSDRLVQVGTLAAGVAHEVNNPLAYVMGNLEYALRALSSPLVAPSVPEQVMDALATALEGAQRIRATTDDLRVFARTGDVQPHAVQLRRVLDSAIGMAGTQIRYRAKLLKDFEEVPTVAANENRLGQVFLNLLINAAQAIPEGHSAEHEIRVQLRRMQDDAVVEISDTGVGLAPEVRKRLFQPFVTTKPKEEGTGLGLSICRRIVQDYHGEISARANTDRGTTFQVRLPLGEALPARTTPPPELLPEAPRRGRLLVIDDEPEIVDLIRRELCAEHDVVGVMSSRSALALLRKDQQFDMILCDLMMPGMNGMQLYEALGRVCHSMQRRIAFMTGGAFTTATRQFLSMIPNPSITKPFEASIVAKMVRVMLAREDSWRRPLGAAS